MTTPNPTVQVGDAVFANTAPLALIAGPCQLESRQHAFDMAGRLVEMTRRLGIGFVYKTSYDKANRTSLSGARGAGLDAAWLAHISADPTWLPVTIACLTLAGFLGLGNGAVFKAVPLDFPQSTGAATGIVGAAGGLGGFFPPVVMGIVKDHFDTYALGFVGLLVFTVICLVVSLTMRRASRMPHEVTA